MWERHDNVQWFHPVKQHSCFLYAGNSAKKSCVCGYVVGLHQQSGRSNTIVGAFLTGVLK